MVDWKQFGRKAW